MSNIVGTLIDGKGGRCCAQVDTEGLVWTRGDAGTKLGVDTARRTRADTEASPKIDNHICQHSVTAKVLVLLMREGRRRQESGSRPEVRCSASGHPSSRRRMRWENQAANPEGTSTPKSQRRVEQVKEETRNCDPHEMLGNTKGVKRMDADRKGRRSDLHQATRSERRRFPHDTRC